MSKNSNTILLKIIFFIETLILVFLSFTFFTQLVNTINTKPTFTRNVSQNNTINKDEANKQLLEAAQHGNLELVKQALANSADINTKDEEGNAPLHKIIIGYYITEAKPSDLITDEKREKTLSDLKETATYLISKGADINIKHSQTGGTPLAYALSGDCEEIAKILISHGAKE